MQPFKLILAVALLFVTSCSNVQPRKPVVNKSASSNQLSIELNKKLYAKEEAVIKGLIKKDNKSFERSNYGFWYRFDKQTDSIDERPSFGDRVTFEYDVVSLSGDTIYRKTDLSPLTKSMETEYGIFRGMRETLKLMRPGEIVEAYYPSYAAYGYYGDEDRIGTNVPFKSRVKLLGINMDKK